MSWTNVEWAHGESIADFAPRMDQMHANNRYLREDASKYVNIMTIPQELNAEKTFYDIIGTTVYGRVRLYIAGISAYYHGTASTTWVSRSSYFSGPTSIDPFIPSMCQVRLDALDPYLPIYYECSTSHNRPIFYWPFNDTANLIRWNFDMKVSASLAGFDMTVTVHIKNMTLRSYYSPGAFASGGFDLDAFG